MVDTGSEPPNLVAKVGQNLIHHWDKNPRKHWTKPKLGLGKIPNFDGNISDWTLVAPRFLARIWQLIDWKCNACFKRWFLTLGLNDTQNKHTASVLTSGARLPQHRLKAQLRVPPLLLLQGRLALELSYFFKEIYIYIIIYISLIVCETGGTKNKTTKSILSTIHGVDTQRYHYPTICIFDLTWSQLFSLF